MSVRILLCRTAAVLLPVILAAACCPCRQLASSEVDSVRVETRVRREVVHDTVMVPLPREAERVVVRDTASHLETSLAVSDARILPDGSLKHTLANRPGMLPVAVEREVVTRDSIVWRDRVESRTVEVRRPLTRWQRVQMCGFWVLLAVAVLLARHLFLSFRAHV